MGPITLHVLVELAIPEGDPRLRLIGKSAAAMAVPETAMYEDDCTAFGKHDIGTTCQIFPMQPEADAHAVQRTSQLQLWRRVLAAYASHMAASFEL